MHVLRATPNYIPLKYMCVIKNNNNNKHAYIGINDAFQNNKVLNKI